MSITTSIANGVITIEIARPEKKNALTHAMYDAMRDALNAAQTHSEVRAALITGQPQAFTTGNDLQDFLESPPTSDDSSVSRFMQALLNFEKPVVAAVTGNAVGIGTTMLFHCDLVYVSEDAKLAMPFVSLGLVPEFGSSFMLPHLVGHVKAAEKLLLGEPFTGVEAVQLGIANAALPAAEVLPHARRMAERFNALPAGAVRDSKRLLRAGLRQSLATAMSAEAAVFVERLKSPEAREAFQAFIEKRKPDFAKTR